jgi:superfamily II DNA or RNA helicase
MKTLRPYQEKAIEQLKKHHRGICILPTSAGKTTIFIEDIRQRMLNSQSALTVVVVAPKILLCNQLAEEFAETLQGQVNYFTTLVHSGEGGTTNQKELQTYHQFIHLMKRHQIMFTTYKSLMRIHEANIPIDVAIFDEAHHSTTESNFVGVAQTSATAKKVFFYTATPKDTKDTKSMLNSDVYGGTIYSLSPKELVSGGYILPPKLESYEASTDDSDNVINFLDNLEDNPKVLVASHSTQSMIDMFTETELLVELEKRGYHVLHITSKLGAVINNRRVPRPVFFETLNRLCNDENAKVIIFHVAILSEGISVPGISHILMLRNLNIIEMVQTIGRVLRLHKEDIERIQRGEIVSGDFDSYKKSCGVIGVPINDGRGEKIFNRLQAIIDTLFIEGKLLVAST